MPPTYTSSLVLKKPDPVVDAALMSDINANADLLDRAVGPVFNARGYGAAADGVADDRAAIQAAVAAAVAAGGGTVHLPRGDYKIASSLDLTGAVRVTVTGAPGARLLPAVGNTAAITGTGCTGCTVAGFTIDASGAGSAAAGIAFYGSTRCRVEGMTILGVRRVFAPAGAGILLSGCTDCVVAGCHLAGGGFGSGGSTASLDVFVGEVCARCDVVNTHAVSTSVTMNIGVENSTWCRVVGNTAGGAICRAANDAFGYGVYAYGTAGVSPVLHCTIADNLIFSTGGMGVYLQTASFTAVTGNVVYDSCKTITGGALAEGAIAANSLCSDLVIAHNVVDTGARGIRFDCPRTQVLGNAIRTLSGVAVAINGVVDQSVIAHNVVTACAAGVLTVSAGLGITGLLVAGNTINGTTASNAGIGLDGVAQLTLVGNLCRACSGYGSTLSNCTGGEVASNTCLSNNAVAGAYDGLAISSNCTTMNIHHNRSTGASQVYGINLAGSGHTLAFNQLAGNGTGPITTVATATTLRGNRYSTGVAQGVATLAGTPGTVTVNTAEIAAADNVVIVRKTVGGTLGHLSLGAIVAGTSFVINSNANETSTVFWEIVH